jgi:tRNA1Val (adenine37-N6)-methyltransferase
MSEGDETTIYPDETQDRLTSRLRIIQKRSGHRAASDDTLLAWVAARAHPGATRVLDLGSGKGTVAMLLLQRLPRCRVVGLEALEVSHDLALRNAQLNDLTDRWEPRLGDLRDPSALAGNPRFALVTGAPPFIRSGQGVVPADLQRAAGRFELRGGVEEYCAAAVRYVGQDGKFVVLMDGLEQSRARAELALVASGFFPRSVLEVRPLPDRNPIYWIFEAALEPGPVLRELLCMRSGEGSGFAPEYESIRREMDVLPESRPS